jgi:hypothetical protein
MTPNQHDDDARADAGATAPIDQFTGAYLVVLDPADPNAGMSALTSAAGVGPAEHVSAEPDSSAILEESEAVVFDQIGVAVVTVDPDQEQALQLAAVESPAITYIEPEQEMSLRDRPSAEYLRGYRDGVNTLVEQVLGAVPAGASVPGPS